MMRPPLLNQLRRLQMKAVGVPSSNRGYRINARAPMTANSRNNRVAFRTDLKERMGQGRVVGVGTKKHHAHMPPPPQCSLAPR